MFATMPPCPFPYQASLMSYFTRTGRGPVRLAASDAPGAPRRVTSREVWGFARVEEPSRPPEGTPEGTPERPPRTPPCTAACTAAWHRLARTRTPRGPRARPALRPLGLV